MLSITFKSVGQGDSILIAWETKGNKHFGFIDSNIVNRSNPILDYIKLNNLKTIDFVIISHPHYDHISGLAEIFEYCYSKNIKIKYLYHTIDVIVGDIYDRIFATTTEIDAQGELIESLDKLSEANLIENETQANYQIAPIAIGDDVSLSFMAPQGSLFRQLAKRIAEHDAGIVLTGADLNKLSVFTILKWKEQCVLLTSDNTKKIFRLLRGKVKETVVLGQVAHHGSKYNLDEQFWLGLNKISKCPVVFSVGVEPKDKLPHKETVEFFAKSGFEIYSTNKVYGIHEFITGGTYSPIAVTNANAILNTNSGLISTSSTSSPQSQYVGDQTFDVFI